MYARPVSVRAPLSKHNVARLSKALLGAVHAHGGTTEAGFNAQCMTLSITSLQTRCHSSSTSTSAATALQHERHFSSTSQVQKEQSEIFEPPQTAPHIRKTPAAWPHPGYTEEQMVKNITYEHREPRDFSDRVALGLMRFLRWSTDLATGYHHDVEAPKKVGDKGALVATKPYRMSERKWLIRFVFLESVAGVPGMVAGMLRHLRSLRRLQRDNGWIETLIEEAYNERMHLLTFLKITNPGIFMRTMILGAQGVFFNSLFFSYLISPRTVHRFVGYLEEEAVLTYSLCIQDLEAGKLPLWENQRTGFKMPAPDLAVGYWSMPEGHRSMRDLLLYIRADEAKHREVNHTLGNLEQNMDPNPFVSTYKEEGQGATTAPHPSKGLEHTRGTGWERQDVL